LVRFDNRLAHSGQRPGVASEPGARSFMR
jgi:hypothetical protein